MSLVMREAREAAKRVADWSEAKRDLVARIIAAK